jgi:4-amino-4-deoxy-L-arabinose transferase-like glycosyltransferase
MGASRWTVVVAATAAFALRLVGLLRPVRADEAGFELVARAWDPMPDSMYGAYFVDRPPLVVAVFKASDALGGPHFIRVVGAVAAALTVVLVARLARQVAGPSASAWTAVAVATLLATPLIDAVAAKGELLALPAVTGALLLAVRATRGRSVAAAAGAGLLSGVALGMKQNLAGPVVFTAVLLVANALVGRLDRGRLLRLSAAALAGLAVPVLATVGWAAVAGVRMHTLWYAVYGFRTDATAALAETSQHASAVRAGVLVLAALGSGLAVLLAAWLAGLRSDWVRDPPVVAATAAMVVADVVALVLGGSFWADYLFPLVPAAALGCALLLHRGGRWRRAGHVLVRGMVVSTAIAFVAWGAWNLTGQQELDEADTGAALRHVAGPGDTLVVFGGRADVQLTSEMASPYPYLWSLPMRALDPELAELRALVTGADAPTWLVEWWPFDTWAAEGEDLAEEVRARYVAHGTACGDRTIWLLRGVDREVPEPDCHGR